jgi:hypothetical protein
MAKVFIEETTLTAIGDAIRNKTGKTELIDPALMSAEIASIEAGSGGGGGDIEIDPIVLTGDCSYVCSGALAGIPISLFPDKISTDKISTATSMFSNTTLEEIPFQINVENVVSLGSMFEEAHGLKVSPKIRGTINWNTSTTLNALLQNTGMLRDVEDLFTTEMLADFSLVKVTGTYKAPKPVNFLGMSSLRRVPSWFYAFKLNPESTAFPSPYLYSNLFYVCRSLDEIVDLPVWKSSSTSGQTSNMFNSTFSGCSRISRFTFETNLDGSPMIADWKNQLIEFKSHIGYVAGASYVCEYNSGITADKEVRDDATYQALKNDPDWFATFPEWCRYNHDSAVETINSLPDTSAFLAAKGGTNTIKFIGNLGSKTDGGAINTLTEEEIAVATAKGWTVSFA